MKLAIFWIVAVLSCCKGDQMDERLVLADIRQLNSNRNIPALFKRTYVEWVGETACISQSLKSSEAEIKQKGPLRFSMKARTSARTGNPLMKVELWLEFYNLTKKVHKSNRYEALIRPIDSEIQSTNQTSPEPVISEEGRLVEISFNVTEIYHTSKALGKKHVNFRINIRGHPKRAAKELHGSTNIKAFLIIQEYEEICNDDFPMKQPGRFKRSLWVFNKDSRGVHTSNEDVYPHHHRRIQSTMNTMLSILSDNAGMNISWQNHLHKKSSRMLKNLRSGINTRVFERSSGKKKQHFHHEPEPKTNSILTPLHEIMDIISSNTNPLQKQTPKTLLSISNINDRSSRASAKEYSSSNRKPKPTTISKLNTLHAVSISTSNKNPFQKKMLKTSEANIWRSGGTFAKNFIDSDQPTVNVKPSSFHIINTSTSDEFQKRSHRRNVLKALHPNTDSNTRTSCGLKDWYVSFAHIGWDTWVIAPAGVRAKTCSGMCSFPLGSDINSTAHAHLQSFVYYFKGEKWPACCVPNDFDPLTMILYDVTDRLLFMAKYPNMIATSCACL